MKIGERKQKTKENEKTEIREHSEQDCSDSEASHFAAAAHSHFAHFARASWPASTAERFEFSRPLMHSASLSPFSFLNFSASSRWEKTGPGYLPPPSVLNFRVLSCTQLLSPFSFLNFRASSRREKTGPGYLPFS